MSYFKIGEESFLLCLQLLALELILRIIQNKFLILSIVKGLFLLINKFLLEFLWIKLVFLVSTRIMRGIFGIVAFPLLSAVPAVLIFAGAPVHVQAPSIFEYYPTALRAGLCIGYDVLI